MHDKSRLIVLDIETYRTRVPEIVLRIEREAIEKQPAQNVAKAVKDSWDTEASRDRRAKEALSKTALNVLLAEPLCVCWRADGAASDVSTMTQDDGVEEKALRLLVETWNEQAGPDTIWVGHNIHNFDLSVLLNRWRRFGIRPPEHFPQFSNGRWYGRTWDTMRRTPCDSGLGLVSLKTVCEAYGIEGAKSTFWRGEPIDGARVSDVYEAGEYDLILDYCRQDVVIEEALYLVQTDCDTYSTYDTREEIRQQVAEIQDSNLRPGEKAMAIQHLLESAGIIPRAA
jgi:hypothetical protein